MKGNPLIPRLVGLGIGIIGCLLLIAQGVTEEVPRGSLTGRITMQENNRPIPKAAVYLVQSGSGSSRWAETDADGRFAFRNVIAGAYEVSFSAKAHEAPEQAVTVAEGSPTYLDVPMAPGSPHMDFHYSTHTYTPGESPEYQITGFTNSDALELRVYRLDMDQISKSGSFQDVFGSIAYQGKSVEWLRPENVVQTLQHKVATVDAEGVFVETVRLKPLPEGVYWVRASSGSAIEASYALVTRIAAVAKSSASGSLCYVTDIVTGQPIAGADVSLVVQGFSQAQATTNAKGLAEVPAVSRDGSQALMVRHGQSHALVSFWNSNDRSDGLTIVTYTDRPIYRPGHTIEFKGLARRWANDAYQTVPNTPVEAVLTDERENEVQRLSLTTTGSGAFTGSFSLSPEASPGTYTLATTIGENVHYDYVTVANYRKPEMQLTFTPSKEVFTRGDQVEMTIAAEYFFGGPVVGAQVSGSILREDAYGGAWWDSEGGSGEYVQDFDGTMDSNGKFVLRFSSRTTGNPNEVDSRFTVNAYVEEPDGRSVSGESTVLVARGEFGIEINPRRFAAEKGQTVEFEVAALRHGDDLPVAGRAIRIVTATERWANGKAIRDAGASMTLTTGRDGRAVGRITPDQDGTLVIRAIATDDRGNTIETSTQVWVGDVGWYGESDEGMTVTLDKPEYGIGETATAVIRTADPGGFALVTVEADRVYTSQIVLLAGETTRVAMNVERRMAPNAYVSVSYVKSKRFSQADANMVVSQPDRKLLVTVESNATTYLPGQTAQFKVTTRDANGNPVPAEFSLGVVDEAIYALREDRFGIYSEFYPERYSGVSTSYSFPEMYLDADEKGPVSVDIRRKFMDTAAWLPLQETDETGTATVTVELPDNLTGWRATAVAITPDAKVGKAKHTITVKKPVMVRLQAPTFLVDGDEQVVGAVVMNHTDQDAQFDIELKATGATLLGDAKLSASIRKGASHTASWRLRAEKGARVVLTATAVSNGAGRPSDGMESIVPVVVFGASTRQTAAGSTNGRAIVSPEGNANVVADASKLTISLSSSLAGDLLGTLDSLVDYPYGCVEQTMSRFMPLVVASRATETLGLPPLRRRAEIPAMVADGYMRLRNLRQDGGWGWWQHGAIDPYMTAYVLEGFYRAGQAGYPAPADLVGPALEAAKKALSEPLPARKGDEAWVQQQRFSDVADRAYLAFALALNGQAGAAQSAIDGVPLDRANTDAVALIGQTAAAIGDGAKLRAVLNTLNSTVQQTDQQAHWANSAYYGVETTARATSLLSYADPSNPLLPKALRYLMSARQGDRWASTRDTALTVVALLGHLQRTQETLMEPTARISLNGELIGEFTLARLQANKTVNVPVERLKPGRNIIEILAEGGTVYYSVQFDQVEAKAEIVAAPSPIVQISRSYHTLEPRRHEDGTLRLMASKNPVTQVPERTPVRVTLTIEANQDIDYAMIEDPFPSNMRPQVRYDLEPWEDWTYWFTGASQRDDRMVFFSRNIPKGRQTITYELVAESVGKSRVPPAKVSNMYDPSVFAASAGSAFEVTRR